MKNFRNAISSLAFGLMLGALSIGGFLLTQSFLHDDEKKPEIGQPATCLQSHGGKFKNNFGVEYPFIVTACDESGNIESFNVVGEQLKIQTRRNGKMVWLDRSTAKYYNRMVMKLPTHDGKMREIYSFDARW